MMSRFKRAMALLMTAVMIVGSVSVTAEAKSQKKAVKSVKVSNVEFGTVVLKPKKSFKLKTKVTVTGKASKKVTYSSSKKKVATVSKSGKIKALKKGKTKITVKSKADKKKKAVVTVIVGTPVTKVTLDKQEAALTEGETLTLNAVLSPQKPAVKKINWSSDNPDVAEVSTSGVVSAKKEGTAVITAKAMDNSGKKAVCKVTVVKKSTPENPTPDNPKPDNPNPDNPNPDDPKPDNPTIEEPTLSHEGYELKWEDDFEGTELNRDDWNVELHDPGWVNAELQKYVDSTDNIYVKDGSLVIKPIKTGEGDKATYTSGRVNTQGKHDFTYGLFEARVKVPTGKGYLPAFWMMPTDENLYGQWPKCGEIDIMEVMGQENDKVYGTIHYGAPHAESQGIKKLTEDNFSDEYHVFSCEWEPGSIKWYVDGVLYHQENDWFSAAEGQGTVSYPAPFDQPFYMILNLAVGGSWVGYPDDTTDFADQAFVIDYVKAYQKTEGYDDSKVTKPEKPPVTLRDPDEKGNYANNGDFSVKEDLTDDVDWSFATALGGEATAEIVDDAKMGGSAIKIETTEKGTVDYSVQLLQHKVPLKQGNKYKLTFDAYAEEARTMFAGVGAIGDRSWKKYVNKEINLTTEKQEFSCEFAMSDADYADARIEFNMGNVDPTATIYISNVKLEVTDTFTVDDSKTVRADGNYVYNGSFQEGADRMEFWEVVDAGKKATVGVTDIKDGRRLKATSSGCAAATDVVLKQTELPLTPGKYELSFDAELKNPAAGESADLTVHVAGKTETFTLKKDETKPYTYKFEIAEDAVIADIDDIVFDLGVNGTVLLDNVRLVEDTLIKNGSFNAGTSGYEIYVDGSASASYVVDSQSEDNALDLTIKNTGDAEWKIQVKQSNVKLEKDKCYELKFDIKSSIDRSIQYAIQRDGSVYKTEAGGEDWTPYVQKTIDLTAYDKDGAYTTVSEKFKMEYDTDEGSIFNIALGGGNVTAQHRVCIDNISLVEIDESEMPKEPEVEAKEYDTNLFTDPEMAEDNTWILQGKDLTGNSAAIEEGKASFTVASLGKDEWDVELKQENLTLEKDEYYVLSFDIKSDVDRKVKTKFQQNGGSYTTYFSEDITLTAGETYKYTSKEFKMENKSDDKALFAIDMGNLKETLDTHHVEISNLCYMKVHHEGGDPTEEDPTEEDPTETLDEEKLTLEDVEKTVTEDDKQDNIYDLQVTEKPVALVAGYKYEISFTACSDSARSIQYGVQKDGSKDNDWATYKEDTRELEAGEGTPITWEFVMPKTDKNAIFFINYAQKDALGKVTFKDMSLKAVAAPEETESVNMLSGGVKSALTGWADKGPEEFTVTLGDESEVENIWDNDFQLLAENINIVKGKTYKISFKITSKDARQVLTCLQQNSGDYTKYGSSGEIDLEAGVEKLIECTFTMKEDTDDKAAFVIQLAKPSGSSSEKTVTIKDLSLVEVTTE